MAAVRYYTILWGLVFRDASTFMYRGKRKEWKGRGRTNGVVGAYFDRGQRRRTNKILKAPGGEQHAPCLACPELCEINALFGGEPTAAAATSSLGFAYIFYFVEVLKSREKQRPSAICSTFTRIYAVVYINYELPDCHWSAGMIISLKVGGLRQPPRLHHLSVSGRSYPPCLFILQALPLTETPLIEENHKHNNHERAKWHLNAARTSRGALPPASVGMGLQA